MSTPIFYDSDADLSIVQAKRLAFIGYGNQGAVQSQNLRDSGVLQILISQLSLHSHTNQFGQTGKKIDRETIDILRFVNGKAVEHWGAEAWTTEDTPNNQTSRVNPSLSD